MSFSGKVREELAGYISPARHCRIAETAALIGMCGTVVINSFDRCSIKIHSENLLVARKVFTLLQKTFNIKADISARRNIWKESVSYAVIVRNHADALRVLQATKFTASVGTLLMLATSSVCFIFAPEIISLFQSSDPVVLEIGTAALRFQAAVLPLTGITTTANMGLQSTGQAAEATILASCRQGICFIPLVLALPGLIGIRGVELAQPLSDLITFILSIFFMTHFIAKLKKLPTVIE